MALFGITLHLGKKLAISSSSPVRIIACGISGKAYRIANKDKPKPYDYKNKNYNLLQSLFWDKTTSRFDENTKLIVVDGPIAAGKTQFAKQLAQELDMFHIEDATMDIRYINPYGYDMRQLDPLLPESVKSFDEKNFCENPYHLNVAAFQMWKYQLRYSRYIDALAHLLSTGEGVVIERSPWSDTAFVEAMTKNKYMSKQARYVYREVKRNTIDEILRPHLVIYLDIPVSKVRQNINDRGFKHETSSKALTDSYLKDIEDNLKTKYLPEMSQHSELLIYDWSEGGDVEVVVEDIERIDFDQYTKHDSKLADWCIWKEKFWAGLRRKYSDKKHRLMNLFNVPLLDAPELIAPGEDVEVWERVWFNAPGMEYAEGYNIARGDKGVWLKTQDSKYVAY